MGGRTSFGKVQTEVSQRWVWKVQGHFIGSKSLWQSLGDQEMELGQREVYLTVSQEPLEGLIATEMEITENVHSLLNANHLDGQTDSNGL